ncbi:threonine-phosphate decarboxylase CobD [[Clostridium] polysaccharolyticum]|uniref:threonine-phosphate decarboxylase n=1 Tax=[Clostridium] polysaccharolyticum TaxID=29364 RepID=A0A1H9Y6L8_9FIRM|nr:threonine-phosphate decarboxylase CobD [[Clostridium] polysaccharolyticum]SES64398.1 L-threonine O-3-phosphate decarboxylase [[Clostridium] polysaccharolyticum]
MEKQEKQAIQQKEHFHGSDLEKIERIYHIKKEEITSFSANINPLGVSLKLRETLANHIDAITSYPDREYASLRESIAAYIKASKEHIMVGNGSTELISSFISVTAPKKALLLAPTYSEYEREITLCGGNFSYYALKKELDFRLPVKEFTEQLSEDLDLLILCNPNNPTSTTLTREEIRQILTACKKKNIYVIVDETYIEFTENISQITAIGLVREFDNLTVLRGISKFFAAPGLRLGYAVCSNQHILDEIKEKKNPWTINSLASIAGEIMFTDDAYINASRTLISNERQRLCAKLNQCPGLKAYPSTANFVLVEILKKGITAFDLFEAAIRKGLMIRDCSTFEELGENFFRFCFMKPEKNDELMDVILGMMR